MIGHVSHSDEYGWLWHSSAWYRSDAAVIWTMLSMASTGFGTVSDPTCMTGTLSVFGVPGRPETAGLQPVKK